MIGVVDSGICNLFSIINAFEAVERPARPVRTVDEIGEVERIVLPGVGAFAAGMNSLRSRGLDKAIVARARDGVPILGVCLGMQLLAEHGTEGGDGPGLGLVKGHVALLEPGDRALRVPHVGWNNFSNSGDNRLLDAAELGDEPDFYFVHSFHFEPDDNEICTSTVDYGVPFVGAFAAGSIFGCQFHPELSHHNGLKVLRAFADLPC